MIKHIVLFGLAEQAEGKTKAENALIIKNELEGLAALIPELKKIEVGINCGGAPQGNYDLALCCEFENMADLDIYQNHPEHQRVGGYIGKVRVSRAAVDYETL